MLARLIPLALLAAVAASGRHVPSDGASLLPPPSGALEFEPGAKEIGLDELLARLAQLTGQELAMTQQARQSLAATREPLESAAPVPKEEVYSFVEALLARAGALIAPITRGTRPILGVTFGRNDGVLDPLHVRGDAMAELALHPALFVRLLVSFQHMDARQVQTQVRQLVVENSGTSQCVPVADRGLILQGRASDVASLARLLVEADEAAGKLPPVPAPKAEGQGQ